MAPSSPHQPLRRSPRKNPFAITTIDPHLLSFPDHCMALSLFLEWSEDRKNKELSKTRHFSQSSTADAAGAQALEAILSRNSQNPSYAFEVVLGKIKPSVDNAVRDGVLLQLAGRFAGPDYIPQGGNSDTLLSFVAKLGEAWLALRPQIFQCVQEVSMSRFDELVKRILEYFRYRAVWAKEDFSGVPELAPVVQRILQQAEEAEALIKGYRARISDGIKTGQVSIAQAHKCWFDLFYPFCKEYGGWRPTTLQPFGKLLHLLHWPSSGISQCNIMWLRHILSSGRLSSSSRLSRSSLISCWLTRSIHPRMWSSLSNSRRQGLAALLFVLSHRLWDMARRRWD